MSVNIQYVGFKSKAVVRDYSFLLRESSIEPHEIRFTILNQAFRSHGLRYQDAPGRNELRPLSGR
jgi:EAL domain-containing protein (putative c-di-GMP-specific phosphodiesterase class I)